MNTQNNFTIQFEQNDIPQKPLPQNEWETLRDSAYSTIAQLKKIKFSIYKEKLNLYGEKCKVKDDVILALQTCLETYKNTNENNNDLIVFLKSKLAERHSNIIALKEAHKKRIADYEDQINRQNEKIATQCNIIKQNVQQIQQMHQKIKDVNELFTDYNKEICMLKATVDDSYLKIAERDNKIAILEAEIEKTGEKMKTAEDMFLQKLQFDASLKFLKENYHLMEFTIKELREVLCGERKTEIKIITLPRIGPIKLAVENVPNGSSWMIIQRRGHKYVNFNQGWFSFVEGFGNLDEDYWIGLEKIHAMTKYHAHELYVHLVFGENDTRYAYYDHFAISGKSDDYKLRSLGNYIGNAGDGLRLHEHHIFKTIRYETDTTVEYNRWWQHDTPNCNLNGSFNDKTEFGVWWCQTNGNYNFVEAVQMLIRRK